MKLCVAKLFHGFPNGVKQQVVHLFRIPYKQTVEFIRYGEHNMKIGNRKQILFAIFNPCFALRILALWAMPVTAGVIADANMPALIAFIFMSTQI